jgi:transcription termination/antitermination protein NusG
VNDVTDETTTETTDIDELLALAGAGAPADDAVTDAETLPADDASEPTPELEPEPVVQAPAPRPRPRSIDDVRDQKDLARLLGDWYVVHTYAG